MHGLWQPRCSVIGVKVKVRVAAAIPKCPKLSGWWTSISSLPFPYIMTSPSCPFSYFSSLLFPYYVRINSLFSQLHYFPLCYSLFCLYDFSLRPHDFSLFSLPLWFSYVHSYFRLISLWFPQFLSQWHCFRTGLSGSGKSTISAPGRYWRSPGELWGNFTPGRWETCCAQVPNWSLNLGDNRWSRNMGLNISYYLNLVMIQSWIYRDGGSRTG